MMEITDKIYEAGTLPPLGTVPDKMFAWTIREERFGLPVKAFAAEKVDTPQIKADEVLVAVVSAGVNYNGIWAASGKPKNVVASNGNYGDKHKEFQICGSEASGIVYAVGEDVHNVSVGDNVIISGARYDKNCKYIKEGIEPEYSPSYHIWGYESNWGAFAQFCKVYDYQCIKKPDFMTWDEAATIGATSVPVNRMLCHWEGNRIKAGDAVLVWGGAGGIGSTAIQQCKAYGAECIAVVSDDERGEYCISLGAKGYINRKEHPFLRSISGLDDDEYKKWLIGASRFRNEIYSILGKRKNPDIVIEHPGSETLAASLFVCANGGMVVLCGATSGYIASVDLRHLWMYQKRIQGSHGGSAEDFKNYIELKERKGIKDVVSQVYNWNELAIAHQDLHDGKIHGKAVVRIINNIKDN